jgi:hypothetical protein
VQNGRILYHIKAADYTWITSCNHANIQSSFLSWSMDYWMLLYRVGNGLHYPRTTIILSLEP